MEEISEDFIKITDYQLMPLWQDIDCCYKLALNLENQNIGDQVNKHNNLDSFKAIRAL